MSKLHFNPNRTARGVVRPLAVAALECSVGVDAAQWPLFSSCTIRTRVSTAIKPPVASSRVAELRAAVRGGTYKVDTQKIASRLIFSEQGTGMTTADFLRGLRETLQSDRSALITNEAECIAGCAQRRAFE